MTPLSVKRIREYDIYIHNPNPQCVTSARTLGLEEGDLILLRLTSSVIREVQMRLFDELIKILNIKFVCFLIARRRRLS